MGWRKLEEGIGKEELWRAVMRAGGICVGGGGGFIFLSLSF